MVIWLCLMVHKSVSNAQRIRDIVEEIELADQLGLDIYGLGEHHRPDYADQIQ